MSTPHLFFFGLGYTGMALARRLAVDGWRISGTCRDPAAISDFSAQGIAAFAFSGGDPVRPDILDALKESSHVLSTAPTLTEGDPDRGESIDPVLRTYGEHLGRMTQLDWLGYLSTTGVYGDTGGQDVDEQTPPRPSGIRGERRLAAEQDWLSLRRDHGLPVHIFRLPGIYGPGRSSLDQARSGAGRRIHKPGHLFNRVHVDDIALTLHTSMMHPHAGAIEGSIYNVCDDEPATPAEVTAFACGLLGIEPPPLVPFDEARDTMSAMALSFWRDNRRVSNARIRNELGVVLSYPTYREGLTAILRAEQAA